MAGQYRLMMLTHNPQGESQMSAPARTGPVSDIVMLDAVDLATAIREKRVSCREVMQAHLDQIERFNPAVNAVVSLLGRDVLMQQAAERDTQLARSEYLGWMHGFPHAVKDLAPARGIRTTLGSPIFANQIPAEDAIFVERLRRNGAILIGKTNVPEFGMGSHTYNPVFGTTRNAYDPAKSAGGSSGGSAVALALRMVPVADGSDFGGSLRNPAGWNAVFGFRPSAGRVPAWPTLDVFGQQLATDGPMARTVADLAMLLSVMAGYDPRTPLSLSESPESFTEPLKRDFKGARIGWLGDLRGKLPMEAGVLDLCLEGLRALEAAGCSIEPAELGVSEEHIWETWLVLRHWLQMEKLLPLYNDPEKRAQLKPEAIWEIEGGLKLSAADISNASARRSAIYQAFRALFESYDFLALPSAQVFPFDADLHWPAQIAGARMDTYHRWMEVVFPATLSGCPVISVPAGFGGPDDLPMGIQIIGPNRQDLAVLQIAYTYEAATGWTHRRLPPMLQRG